MSTYRVSAVISITFNADRTIATGDETSPYATQKQQIGNYSANLATTGTSPDAIESFSDKVELVAGAKTINMTSMAQAGLSDTIDMTGKYLRAIYLYADPANSNSIAIGAGSSNGYTGFGTVSYLLSGQRNIRTMENAIPVDATHKTLDLSGSGTESLWIHLIFGSTPD